jgi:hypothetical protein
MALGPHDVFVESCLKWLTASSLAQPLWHYTSLESLLRIVETKSLLLTSERFLNDPNEGLIARDWIHRLAKEALKIAVPESKDFWAEMIEYTDREPGYLGDKMKWRPGAAIPNQYFLFSLSAGAPRLSQWSRYAANGADLTPNLSPKIMSELAVGVSSRTRSA